MPPAWSARSGARSNEGGCARFNPDVRPRQFLTAGIVILARDCQLGRRRFLAALAGKVALSAVERMWRRESFRAPRQQTNDAGPRPDGGSYVRLCSRYRGQVRSFGIVEDHTHNDRRHRMVNFIGERSCDRLAMVPFVYSGRTT